MYIYVCIYLYIYMYTYMYVYISMYVYKKCLPTLRFRHCLHIRRPAPS